MQSGRGTTGHPSPQKLHNVRTSIRALAEPFPHQGQVLNRFVRSLCLIDFTLISLARNSDWSRLQGGQNGNSGAKQPQIPPRFLGALSGGFASGIRDQDQDSDQDLNSLVSFSLPDGILS